MNKVTRLAAAEHTRASNRIISQEPLLVSFSWDCVGVVSVGAPGLVSEVGGSEVVGSGVVGAGVVGSGVVSPGTVV